MTPQSTREKWKYKIDAIIEAYENSRLPLTTPESKFIYNVRHLHSVGYDMTTAQIKFLNSIFGKA